METQLLDPVGDKVSETGQDEKTAMLDLRAVVARGSSLAFGLVSVVSLGAALGGRTDLGVLGVMCFVAFWVETFRMVLLSATWLQLFPAWQHTVICSMLGLQGLVMFVMMHFYGAMLGGFGALCAAASGLLILIIRQERSGS